MTTALREKHESADATSDAAPDVADDRLSLRLWLRLLSCAMVIEKRVKRRLADRYATTLPRFDVLASLARAPDGLTMSELSRALLVSNGNVTALVQTLSRDGLVALRTAPHDRRASIVTTTALGRERFAEWSSAHNDWIDAMFGDMSAAQRRRLLDLLGSLKTSIANSGNQA